MPLDVQKAARKLSSKVQAYTSDVEYIAEEDFVERKKSFEKLLHAELEKVQKAEADAVEDSKGKCYRGLGGGSYEVAYLSKGNDPQCDQAPMQTSTSARTQALTAEEVASRCQEDPEALFLCDVGIGDTDIDALTAGLKRAGQNLTMLDISSNNIADAGVQKLVTGFAGGICPKLTELFIGCNSFGEQGRTMLSGGLSILRKGLTINADDSGTKPSKQEGRCKEPNEPATTKQEPQAPQELQEVTTIEQEAKSCDIESPASRKKKSPTGADLGAPSISDLAPEGGVDETGNAFSGSATVIEESQEVHVVIPLAGSSVTAATDLDLDISAWEVRIAGPGGLSVSVTLPAAVEPGSAQASFSKKRQQMVVKLKMC